MGMFDGLGRAETFERGTYLNPGYYVVKIDRVLAKKSRDSGVGVIAELDILQSTFRPQVDPKNQNRTWQNTPAGIQGTWWQAIEADGAMASIKGFVRAVLGLRPATHPAECAELDSYPPGLMDQYGKPIALIENLMTHATGDGNFLAGLLVSLECYMIETAKKKADFTVYNWTPLDFAGLGIQGPDVRGILGRAARPLIQLGFNPGPPAWGPPPGPPAWGPPPGPPAPRNPPGATLSPDGKWFCYPGQPWQPVT